VADPLTIISSTIASANAAHC